jgi:cystathionine beta-lyase/cystathionine gamma-synthase
MMDKPHLAATPNPDGISYSLLRLSVGLENVEDPMADIAQALDHVHASKGEAD